MELVKWIVFMIFSTLAEGAPRRKETDPEDMFYVHDFNNFTKQMGNSSSELFNSDFWRNTMKFMTALPTSVVAQFSEKEFTIEQKIFISLEVYLHDLDLLFETEIFPFTYLLGPFEYGNGTDLYSARNLHPNIEYPFLDKCEVKLYLPSDRHFSLDDQNQIIRETKRLLKVAFNSKNRNQPAVSRVPTWMTLHRNQIIELNRLHTIRTISATTYDLTNLVVSGLENIETILIYLPGTFRTIVKNVRGNVVQSFHSDEMPAVEFSFKMDSLWVSANCFLNTVYVRGEGYSFVDTKLNKTLDEDQAKLIMRDIEAAFESTLQPPEPVSSEG